VPGAGDVAPWDATVTAPNTTSLGVDTTWAGIRIADPAGLVTINAGNTLTLGAAAIDINMASAAADLTLNCPLVLGAANVWDVAPGQVLTLGDVVSGAGAITKQGGGTAILTGGNTFSAGLTLSAGSLNLNHFTALGDAASTFTIAGGTFDNTSGGPLWLINNNPQAWNADVTFLGSQDLDLGLGAVTLNANRTVTVNANSLTVGGAVGGGAFNLTKEGTGALTLNGNNTISGALNMNAGTLTLVGAPEKPHPSPSVFGLIFKRRQIAGSLIGGIRETQEMLDFCAKHGIVSDIETIPMDYINTAYERMLKSDVKYRFVIDMASMK